VQATGRYSLAVPPSLERRYRQGIDSAVDQFVGEGVQLNLDYGLYGGGFSPGRPGLRTEPLPGDGRMLGWSIEPFEGSDTPFRWTFTARISDPRQPPATGPFPPPPSPGLTLSMHCRTAELCEIGPAVARSVRFGAGRPLSERLVFLKRAALGGAGTERMQGPLVVDSNGCLRLTDPADGVPGPVLVWPAEARLELVRNRPAIAGGVGRAPQVEGDFVFVTGRRLSSAGEAGLAGGASPACAGPAFAVDAFGTAPLQR
jgi:hypothetical protein